MGTKPTSAPAQQPGLFYPGAAKTEEPAQPQTRTFGNATHIKRESSNSNNIEETYEDDFDDEFEAAESARSKQLSNAKARKPEPAKKPAATPSQSQSEIGDELSGFEDKYDEDFF